MSKTKLFSHSLLLELYLIGYPNQGESVVFLVRTDNVVAYVGVVDCYQYDSINKTVEILNNEHIDKIDFLCWTHPHDDHSKGIDAILDHYCDSNTKIWLTDLYPEELSRCNYSNDSKKIYTEIKSRVRNLKSNIKFAKNNTILDRFKCEGLETYMFEIVSFAPDSTIIAERKELKKEEQGNCYSIGLNIFAGRFCIMLCGDVENPTIDRFEDVYLY